MYARGKILLDFQKAKLFRELISLYPFVLLLLSKVVLPAHALSPRKENKPYFLANYLTRFPLTKPLKLTVTKLRIIIISIFCAGFRHVYQKRSPTMEPP